MLNKLNYLSLFTYILITLSFTQNGLTQNILQESQRSLEQRGFQIISCAENAATVQFNNLKKIQVKVALSDLDLPSLLESQQNSNDIMNEDFEDSFPAGSWQVSGDTTWGKTDYMSYNGQYSAWCASGGTNPFDPEQDNYPNNYNALMIYGPFSLKEAEQSEFNFFFWIKTEEDYDWFFIMASTDGENFVGEGYSGDGQDNWYFMPYNLNTNYNLVSELGNLNGKDSIWIALAFSSNESNTDKGVFVDDISLIQSDWYAPYESIPLISTLYSVHFVQFPTLNE